MTGKIEETIKKRAKREDIQNKLALVLARLTARNGRLLFVPEPVLIKQLGLDKKPGRNPAYAMRQALWRLNRKGLLVCTKTEGGWTTRLTPKGQTFADKLDEADRICIKKPERWDGRWRIVIFDIWERRRPVRDKLRRMLQKAGFIKIQDSVWVHPYECEELVVFLRTEMRLGTGVLYIVAEGIENDAKLKKHFKLP